MDDRLTHLEQRLEEHIKEHNKTDHKVDQLLIFAENAQPIIDALNGASALGRLIRWAAGVIVAIGALWIGIQWAVRHAL